MILPRYFLREALKLSFVIVAGLVVVYFSLRFATSLGEAAEGKVAPQHILRIVALKMLVSVKDLLPMALLLGTFAAATRLVQDSEWVAMRAAGLGHGQLLRPALLVGLLAALVVGLITVEVGPRAEFRLAQLREQSENEATIAGVKAGRFRELSDGKRVFYAETISTDGRFLENAFVRSRGAEDDEREGALRSRRAFIQNEARTGSRYAVFEDGRSYAGQPGALDYVVTEFERYAVRIESREPTEFGQHIGFLPVVELFGRDQGAYLVELQWRLALPVCTLMAPLLATLVATGSQRRAWYLGLMGTVALYLAYTNLLGVGRALLKKGLLPAAMGLWPLHLVFALLLVSMLYWQRGRFRRRRAPRQELLRA